MSRMLNVEKGPRALPIRLTLYGPPGAGKTTFGADAPAPILLPAEDGAEALGVARFPRPESWDDAVEAVDMLSQGRPQLAAFQTLVIDTADALDTLARAKVCLEANRASTIEDVGGGYGKGYTRVQELWVDLLRKLDHLQTKRGMHVIILAHGQIEKLKLPGGDEVSRWGLKLHQKSGAQLTEWTRDLFFTTFDVRKQNKWSKASLAVGKRIMLTAQAEAGAYVAKNRLGLPVSMPLSFAAYAEARQRALASIGATDVDADLLAEVAASVDCLPETMRVDRQGRKLLDLALAQGTAAMRKLLNWAVVKADELAADRAQERDAPPADAEETEDEADGTLEERLDTDLAKADAAPDPSPGATSPASGPAPSTPPAGSPTPASAEGSTPAPASHGAAGSSVRRPAKKVPTKV